MAKIIFIAGNPQVRQSLQSVFRFRFPSVEMMLEADGEDLLKKAESFHPDIIFMDLHLREKSSFDLVNKLKKKHPDIFLVLMGSHDSPEYQESASAHGADYLIRMNSSIEEYIGLIERVLEIRESPRPM